MWLLGRFKFHTWCTHVAHTVLLLDRPVGSFSAPGTPKHSPLKSWQPLSPQRPQSDHGLGPLSKAILLGPLRPRVHCWGEGNIKVTQLHLSVKCHFLHKHQSPTGLEKCAFPPGGLGEMDPKTPSPQTISESTL